MSPRATPGPRVQRVHDILLDMKDTSELMVDLGHSSVLYGSRRIAEEVLALEESVGRQLTDLQRLCLEAVREGELDVEHALVLIRVAQAAEVIANAALEIADVVLRDVELHPVLQAAILDSESSITKLTLGPEAPWRDRSLADLELETETGMRVLAVRRGDRWHPGVGGDFVLQAGDLLVAMGPSSAMEAFEATGRAGAEPE